MYINRTGIDIDQQCHRLMGVPLPPFIFKLSQGSRWGNARVDAHDVGNLRFREIKTSLRNFESPRICKLDSAVASAALLNAIKVLTCVLHISENIIFVNTPPPLRLRQLKSVDKV